MATVKSLISFSSGAALLLLLIAFAAQTQMAQSQSCSSKLNNLTVCAPYVVPGAADTNPSKECCDSLGAVDGDCFCNTMRIVNSLPSQCQLPAITCGA